MSSVGALPADHGRTAGAPARVLVQTMAMLVDAYRELNAKKLFWITMMLSGLVVAVFAAFGLNEKGLTFLWWEFPIPLFNSTLFPPASFYKMIFATFGIPVWLTWVASILALISTAGIFPDFISGGSIELSLSKPISRLRLFLTKYFMGLLFVFLQVLVFTAACFLVIGLRGAHWDFALFLAVPIVVCFYSYLYCFCVLMGLLTRSTIAAVLLTCLFWIAVFACNAADAILLQQRIMSEIRVEKGEARVARAEKSTREKVERERAKAQEEREQDAGGAGAEGAGEGGAGAISDTELLKSNPKLAEYRRDLVEDREGLANWAWWSGMIFQAKTVLPKTGETVDLLNRYILTSEERRMFVPDENDDEDAAAEAIGVSPAELTRRAEEAAHARPVWWVLGTSLVFEAVVVGIGAVIFVRRDF